MKQITISGKKRKKTRQEEDKSQKDNLIFFSKLFFKSDKAHPSEFDSYERMKMIIVDSDGEETIVE